MNEESRNHTTLTNRIEKIENDEYGSSKKLYDHTRYIIYIGAFLIATVFSVIAFLQFTAISDTKEKTNNLIEVARLEIDRLLGKNIFTDYNITYEVDNNALTLYGTVKVNEEELYLTFSGPIEIYGTDDIYGDFKGATVRVIKDELSQYFIDEAKNNLKKNLFKRRVYSLKTFVQDSFINKNTGVVMVLRTSYGIPFDQCYKLKNINNVLKKKPNIHGHIEVTPIILNKKGIVDQTIIPFNMVLDEVGFDCSTINQ